MGNLRQSKTVEMHVLVDPNMIDGDYDVVFPYTITSSVFDPTTGTPLQQVMEAIRGGSIKIGKLETQTDIITQQILDEYAQSIGRWPLIDGMVIIDGGDENGANGHDWRYDANIGAWVDLGAAIITIATNDSLGIVKGNAGRLGVSISGDGTLSVNGIEGVDKMARDGGVWCGVAGGSEDRFLIMTSYMLNSLDDGMKFSFYTERASAEPQISIDGLPAIPLKKGDMTNPAKLSPGYQTIGFAQNCFFLASGTGEYGTAGAAQVLEGYTVGTEDGVVPGEMANNGDQTATLATQGATKYIPEGYTLGGIITADITNLSADNIRKGVSVGGIGGTFTSDANATAAQILDDYSAYVNGKQVNGSMPNRGAISQTLTYQNEECNVLTGYHNGNGKVKAVISNLSANNIRQGATVGDVAGNFSNDANATAAQILKGFWAYAKGVKVDGGINSYAAQTWTPQAADRKVLAGYYPESTIKGASSASFFKIATGTFSYQQFILRGYTQQSRNFSTGLYVASGASLKFLRIDLPYSFYYEGDMSMPYVRPGLSHPYDSGTVAIRVAIVDTIWGQQMNEFRYHRTNMGIVTGPTLTASLTGNQIIIVLSFNPNSSSGAVFPEGRLRIDWIEG